jgi:hypothetical protein
MSSEAIPPSLEASNAGVHWADIPTPRRRSRKSKASEHPVEPNVTAGGFYGSAHGVEGDHSPGVMKEFTAWDVYNNESKKVDDELVKDWTVSLNFLLVFVRNSPFVIGNR